MATEHVRIAEIEKPDNKKAVSISETDVDQPIEHGDNAQIEIYSDMGRTRTGIQNSKFIWGNRCFSAKDVPHQNAKPQDGGGKKKKHNPY